MDILALIAAFGGGIIGAYMGALPAFIMTGIYALVGGVLTAAGVGGDVAVNYLAFGSFVGPHIAFAGGVAAAGYAGRKGKLASGTDILSSLNGLGEPDVLLVGGIFGVLGFLIHYCIGLLPVIGSRPRHHRPARHHRLHSGGCHPSGLRQDRPDRQVHRLRKARVVRHREGLRL